MIAPASHDRQAAYWHDRLHDPDASPEEINQALDWIEASPDHQAAFTRIERFLATCETARSELAAHVAPEVAPTDADMLPRDPWRPSVWAGRLARAAAILLVCASVLLIWNRVGPFRSDDASSGLHYASGIGEIRRIALADGSRITLAGSSAVTVAFRDDRRAVTLTEGEAIFEVAKNPARPFVVAANGGFARAVGTIFDVRHDAGRVTVSVLEGLVDVGSSAADRGQRIAHGFQVDYGNGKPLSIARRIDVEAIASWRDGVLVVEDQPLASVVADLNRYSARAIIIDDKAIADLPITGTIRTDGIDEWLNALPTIAGVTVQDSGIGPIRLRHHASKTSISNQMVKSSGGP